MTTNPDTPISETTNSRRRCGRTPTGDFRHRPANKLSVFERRLSFIYKDIEAVVDGEMLKLGSIIPEQYALKKLWEDVKDMMHGRPIRYAEKVKFKIMLPLPEYLRNFAQ